jgi:hypothetical protein
LVALALALAGGGVLAGWSCYRRALRVERKLRALESAVEEFCGALRSRLMGERSRLAGPSTGETPAPLLLAQAETEVAPGEDSRSRDEDAAREYRAAV